MNWIKVSERLPEMEEIVYLWDGQRAWVGGRAECGSVDDPEWFWGNTYGNEFWDRDRKVWRSDTMETDDDYEPTHWQPMPIPPEQEGKK